MPTRDPTSTIIVVSTTSATCAPPREIPVGEDHQRHCGTRRRRNRQFAQDQVAPVRQSYVPGRQRAYHQCRRLRSRVHPASSLSHMSAPCCPPTAIRDNLAATFSLALAHLLHGRTGSLAAEFSHSARGQFSGRTALWGVPAAFVSAMNAGFGLALTGVSLPLIEAMGLTSTVILSLVVAMAVRLDVRAGPAYHLGKDPCIITEGHRCRTVRFGCDADHVAHSAVAASVAHRSRVLHVECDRQGRTRHCCRGHQSCKDT